MSSPNGTAGEWIQDGLVWQQGGLLYFSRRYLAQKHSAVVNPNLWARWVGQPCSDLDPSLNGGRLRSLTVRSQDGRPGKKELLVYAQPDVNQVIRRRTDMKAREADPAQRGEWLDDNLFQLTRDVPEMGFKAGEVLCRDDKLATDAGVSDMTPVYWRRHAHPNLDPAVNGGRLRWLDVPKQHRSRGGRSTVPVSSRSDWKTIMAARIGQQQTGNALPRGRTAAEVAQHFGLNYDDKGQRIGLSFVLRKLRDEFPAAAQQTRRWDDVHNQSREVWHYDLAAIRKWLGKRTIHAVAAELRRVETPRVKGRRDRRLRKAVAFLQFVLTQGRWGPRAFQHFLSHPLAGVELTPCEGVPPPVVKQWAKEAGVAKQLWDAKKTLPIVTVREGLPKGQSLWRLTEPVVIPEAVAAATTEQNAPAASVSGTEAPRKAVAARATGGRPPDERTQAIHRFCYEKYVTDGKGASTVMAMANKQFGANTIKDNSVVRLYARRYAAKHKLPRRAERGT